MEKAAETPEGLHALAAGLVLAGAVMVVGLGGEAARAEADLAGLSQAGACDRTTAALATSCAREAPEEFFQAFAICANVANGSQRERCVRQAGRDLQEAKATCGEQRAARQRVCAALGQAPYDPVIRPADFVDRVTNPYFPLTPGTVLVYRGRDSTTTVTVTPRKVRILGVDCVVVRDTVRVDGEVEEDTLDYYAQDRQGNVWYFGENTAEFANGVAVTNEGSFIAGVDGAKPGIIMRATPKVGVTYRQEFALGDAEDLARVESLSESVRVPYRSFSGALKTFEFTPIEPDARENKYYARGVGEVLTVNLETGEREELVSIRRTR